MAETPLTITVAVWNYCQNACSYCVAGSNLPQWAAPASFEVWKPEGGEHLNDLQLQKRFGQWYFNQCPDKDRFLNPHNVLEVPYLLSWLQRHTPHAVVHLSGGEPLLRPDIEAFAGDLVRAGFEITIFTNGLLLPERAELLDMPLKWVVTHHDPQPLADFLECIYPLRNKPHQITRVFDAGGAGGELAGELPGELQELREIYDGFNFLPRWRSRPQLKKWFQYRPGDLEVVASEVLHFITPNGAVYPCNSTFWPPIGHVYTGEYCRDDLAMIDKTCKECLIRNRCGAYQSAVEVDQLTSKGSFWPFLAECRR
jgi:organic radical activating enzyme